MWTLSFVLLLGGLPWTAGQFDTSTLACAMSCWENSKFVTKCLEDYVCLCSDTRYQSAVFQCLYSQCDTVHFRPALHYALSQCFGMNNRNLLGVLPILNHDSLRRRKEIEYLTGPKDKRYESGSSGTPWPTESIGFPLQSVNFPTSSASLPTKSVGDLAASLIGPWDTSMSTSPQLLSRRRPSDLQTVVSTIPAQTPPPNMEQALAGRFQHFVGFATRIRSCATLCIVPAIVAVYFSM